jgi:Na+/melibiose symporter-like transporter
MPRDILGNIGTAAYSVGHLNNDLCASMWFVYLTYYLKDVVGLDPSLTGFCALSGQIADGITTPLVGIASDSCQTGCGRRMPWYYFGFLFVIPTFAGIFTYPEFVNKKKNVTLANGTVT